MDNLRNASRALTPVALTVLRVVVGIVMFVHGWLKLVDYPDWLANLTRMGVPAPDIFGPLSVAAEITGGVGLIFGLLTPLAALAVLIQMVVAIALVHAEHGLLAQRGGFEYPLTLAAVALFLMARGGGPISLDNVIFGRGPRPRIEEPRRRRVPIPPREPLPA